MIKSNTVLRIGVLAVSISIGFLLIADQMYIDSCLDSGGSIDYAQFRCDLRQTHPAGSYLRARWTRFLLPLAALVGWVLLARLIGKKREDSNEDIDKRQ